MRFPFLLCVVWVGLLVGATGCSLSPLSKRTASFATVAVAATKDSASAYEVVERSDYDVQVASLVLNFDKDGFHPETIQPFLSSKDMEARTRVLEALKQYAETLAEVSGNHPLEEIDTEAAALGSSLQAISSNGDLQLLSANAKFSTEQAGLAATAVDALGKLLIELKRKQRLPEILKAMQEPVNNICSLLEADIGDPEKGGLRNQLKNNYDTLIVKQQQYLHHYADTMTASEKRAAIERLPKLAANAKRADAALAVTQASLAQLAKTHTALVASAGEKESPAFRVLLAELIEESEQLHGFYEKVAAN